MHFTSGTIYGMVRNMLLGLLLELIGGWDHILVLAGS